MKYTPFDFSETEQHAANSANPANPFESTSPQTGAISKFSNFSNGGFENQNSDLPAPLEPSPVWLEAIAKGGQLQPTANYVIELFVPEHQGLTDVRFSRDTERHTLPNALKSLALRFPTASRVEVAKPKTLEPIFTVGNLTEKWSAQTQSKE